MTNRSIITLCTKTVKKLNKVVNDVWPSLGWKCGYLVTMTEGGHELVVDLPRRTCVYRKWQLTSIPYFHASASIFFQQKEPTMYVHECYTKNMYMKVYSHLVEPINGEEFWTPTNLPPPPSPTVKVAPEKPKRKISKKI